MTAWTDIGGASIRYDHKPATGGATFVLLHEMGGTLESWDGVVTQLPKTSGYLRYDQRGAGLSEKLRGTADLNRQVTDLEELLAHCGIDGTVILAGMAVGSAIAIAFATRNPRRVECLVAMSPACGVAAEAGDGTLALADAIEAQGMRMAADALLARAWPEDLRADPSLFAAYRARFHSADPASFASIVRMLVGFDLERELRALSSDAILIAGEKDPLRSPAYVSTLPRGDADYAQIASGHFMAVQSPDTVAALLSAAANGRTKLSAHLEKLNAQDTPKCFLP